MRTVSPRFALSWLLLSAALCLPGCGQPPTDDLLIDGSECSRDARCQSGHCWQDASEQAKTCKAEPQPEA